MQTDRDAYLLRYNTERPHQGRGMNGRAPTDVFARFLPKPRTSEPAPCGEYQLLGDYPNLYTSRTSITDLKEINKRIKFLCCLYCNLQVSRSIVTYLPHISNTRPRQIHTLRINIEIHSYLFLLIIDLH